MSCIGRLAHAAARQADFNGDGRADLAIGVPREIVAGIPDAGGVAVIYGSPVGLHQAGDQFWTQNSPGIFGEPEDGAAFGHSLAAGDFNGDGFSDLAIGIPKQTVNHFSNAGAVQVIYGSATGLNAAGDQHWTRASPGVDGNPQGGANFGWTLAAGDFDGDGHDDLALGITGRDASGQNMAGEVHILFGAAAGLSAAGNQVFNQNTPGIDDQPDPGDFFGEALAAGDFNGDGRDDLAIGVPRESPASSTEGIVHVLFGSIGGLNTVGAQLLQQGVNGVEDTAEVFDRFGSDLAAGDFDGDGTDDLAIGVTGEALGDNVQAGAVAVLYGTPAGLGATDDQFWSQDSQGILDTVEPWENFGWTLAVGDFDNDGRDDLAITSYAETVNDEMNAGAVSVLYGTHTGLRAAGNQFWHQDSPGISEQARRNDRFGYALTAGDYDGDGFDDLAVGVLKENVNGVHNAGAVHAIYGTPTGLHRAGNQLWHQDRTGIVDTVAADERFGSAVR